MRCQPIPALGSDPNSDHADESWCVVGLSDERARAIGAQFGQWTVFRITPRQRPCWLLRRLGAIEVGLVGALIVIVAIGPFAIKVRDPELLRSISGRRRHSQSAGRFERTRPAYRQGLVEVLGGVGRGDLRLWQGKLGFVLIDHPKLEFATRLAHALRFTSQAFEEELDAPRSRHLLKSERTVAHDRIALAAHRARVRMRVHRAACVCARSV